MSFLVEIKRRKIFQVAAVYLVVAWLLIQIVATVEAPLSLPDWVDTLVILLLADTKNPASCRVFCIRQSLIRCPLYPRKRTFS